MGFFRQVARPFKWAVKKIWNITKSAAYRFVDKYEDIFVQILIDIAEGTLTGDTNRKEEAFAKARKIFKDRRIIFRDYFLYYGIEHFIVKLKEQKRIP